MQFRISIVSDPLRAQTHDKQACRSRRVPWNPQIWIDQLTNSVNPILTRGQIMPTTLLPPPPLEFLDLPTAMISGECPSCLEGEVKPLRAERKLTAEVHSDSK